MRVSEFMSTSTNCWVRLIEAMINYFMIKIKNIKNHFRMTEILGIVIFVLTRVSRPTALSKLLVFLLGWLALFKLLVAYLEDSFRAPFWLTCPLLSRDPLLS